MQASNHKGRTFGVILTICVSILIGHSAIAQEVGEAQDFSIHRHFESARSLGMGNAGVALFDDHTSLFLNPASLARIPEAQMNFQLRGMIDKDVVKFVNDLKSTTSGGSEDVQKIADLLAQNYGKHYSLRAPTLGWYWVRPKWGVAIIPLDLSFDLEIHQQVGPAASVIATQDTTIAFGLGREYKWLGPNQFSLGMTVKAMYREYFNKSLAAIELALDSNLIRPSDAQEGLTIDGDIGALFTPRPPSKGFWSVVKPTFGVVVRNVADYGFTTNLHLIDKQTSGKPVKLQRRLDVGSLWELPDWWIWKTRVLADVRDIGHQNWTIGKGYHVGAEFLWKIFSWWKGGWRVGINQGYGTLGATVELGIFKLDAVTYGEEVGPSDAKKENRRYMVNASLDF